MYPIAVGLICILQRTKSAEDNAYWVDFALNHKNGFLALDLADNEVDFDPEPFIPLFQRAKAGGLGITVHAGGAPCGRDFQKHHYRYRSHGCRPHRSGLQAIEDPQVVELLVRTSTPLELCPTSNWLTGACDGFHAHPIKELYDAGVHTTINTDDPGIMVTHLNREFQHMYEHRGFDTAQLQQCVDWARMHSFIPPVKKDAVWPKP